MSGLFGKLYYRRRPFCGQECELVLPRGVGFDVRLLFLAPEVAGSTLVALDLHRVMSDPPIHTPRNDQTNDCCPCLTFQEEGLRLPLCLTSRCDARTTLVILSVFLRFSP